MSHTATGCSLSRPLPKRRARICGARDAISRERRECSLVCSCVGEIGPPRANGFPVRAQVWEMLVLCAIYKRGLGFNLTRDKNIGTK